jgi:hypothetical protein
MSAPRKTGTPADLQVNLNLSATVSGWYGYTLIDDVGLSPQSMIGSQDGQKASHRPESGAQAERLPLIAMARTCKLIIATIRGKSEGRGQ